MTFKQVISALQKVGTAQNRKVYPRHGARQVIGVLFSDIDRIQKQIKVDHKLAQQLWRSGYFEARILALKTAEPHLADLKKWAKETGDYTTADTLAKLAVRAKESLKLMSAWCASAKEWLGRIGFQMLAITAMERPDLEDDFFLPYLDLIAAEIHQRPNRTRDAMNSALIAIGIRNPALQQRAVLIARSIGKVQVDHGETSCKTPDAEAYIIKTLAHRQKRKQ